MRIRLLLLLVAVITAVLLADLELPLCFPCP